VNLKEAFSKLTPIIVVSILAAVLTCAVAFGAPITAAQTNSVLVLGGALSLILLAHGLSRALTYLSPQSIVGLVTAVIGVAAAFGLPITKAQSDSILQLTGLFAGLLFVHGAVHTVARDRRLPEIPEKIETHPASRARGGGAK
jgi:hypothetical protein